MSVDFEEIGKRKLYKQSGASVAITITLPGYSLVNRKEVDPMITTVFPEDLFYSSQDYQFFHYFSKEKAKPMIEKIMERMEKDPSWVKKRLRTFNEAIEGLEELGEKIILASQEFSPKNKDHAIHAFEEFLEKDCSYWCPSLFIDLFDPFENEVIEFIFREKKEQIDKKDLQTLLLPEKSVFWEEKKEFEKIKALFKEKNSNPNEKKVLKKLEEHANKYWWIQNDFQHVKRLKAKDFLKRLEEKPEEPFWETIIEQKKELFQKYGLNQKMVERLQQFLEMAYLRDVRKRITQIANYYAITFFHTIAKKSGIPVEWSNFLVTFYEYKPFLNQEKTLLQELERRTQKGVWVIIGQTLGEFDIETKRARELFELVESRLTGEGIVYGNSASLGKATGNAKIVLRQSDFNKFQEGDVLITGMTRPEFVPLMKKASAIITDEGGITCHAAIVSRELGKPCIIGTQIATKTFKDGDLLEVNANHGMIRKLEEKK